MAVRAIRKVIDYDCQAVCPIKEVYFTMHFEPLIRGGVRESLQAEKHHVQGPEVAGCSTCSKHVDLSPFSYSKFTLDSLGDKNNIPSGKSI